MGKLIRILLFFSSQGYEWCLKIMGEGGVLPFCKD